MRGNLREGPATSAAIVTSMALTEVAVGTSGSRFQSVVIVRTLRHIVASWWWALQRRVDLSPTSLSRNIKKRYKEFTWDSNAEAALTLHVLQLGCLAISASESAEVQVPWETSCDLREPDGQLPCVPHVLREVRGDLAGSTRPCSRRKVWCCRKLAVAPGSCSKWTGAVVLPPVATCWSRQGFHATCIHISSGPVWRKMADDGCAILCGVRLGSIDLIQFVCLFVRGGCSCVSLLTSCVCDLCRRSGLTLWRLLCTSMISLRGRRR